MGRDEIKEASHNALVAFTDFIYAIVFGFIVQETFDKVVINDDISLHEKIISLILIFATFYLLLWDWILGRLLTLRNPYETYTPFFCEVLIAAFSYGAASAAVKGNSIFLIHFGLILFFGGLWARRMEKKIKFQSDSQEFCMIQILHFSASALLIIFYFWWTGFYGSEITWPLVFIILLAGWGFILFYEALVPRYKGVVAGPGVPFINRSRVRRFRRKTGSVVE